MITNMRYPRVLIAALIAVSACSSGGDAEKASDAAAAPIAETADAYRDRSATLRREGKYKEALDAALKAYTLSTGTRVPERLEIAKVHAAGIAAARTKADSAKSISGAINEIKTLEKEKSEQSVPVDEVEIAVVYSLLGDANAVFRWLDRAVVAKSPNLATAETNPDLAFARTDPRWAAWAGNLPR